MFSVIQKYIILFMSSVSFLFGGFGYYQKIRADKTKRENERLQEKEKVNKQNSEIKEFQAINTERKDNIDAEISNIDNNDIKPNTTYEL